MAMYANLYRELAGGSGFVMNTLIVPTDRYPTASKFDVSVAISAP